MNGYLPSDADLRADPVDGVSDPPVSGLVAALETLPLPAQCHPLPAAHQGMRCCPSPPSRPSRPGPHADADRPGGIRIDFNAGARVRLRDLDTGNILFLNENIGAMVMSAKRYYVRIGIEV